MLHFLKIFLFDLPVTVKGMKKNLFFAVVILSFLLMAVTGEAFVPQTPHLLHLVIEKIRQPVGFEILQIQKIFNYQDIEPDLIKSPTEVSNQVLTQGSISDSNQGSMEIAEKLFFLHPNRFRIEKVLPDRTSFSVTSGLDFLRVVDGVTMSRDKSLVDLYTDVILYRDHESLEHQLVLAGIDTTAVSFQRYNDRICYVIGRPGEKNAPFPGLWIEKSDFLPLKYVVEKNGRWVEFFYTHWQKISKTWYPMQVSIFLDNQLFAMVDVNHMELESGFSLSLFDIEEIRRLYPEPKSDPFDENTRQVEELDRRLEDFKKLYE